MDEIEKKIGKLYIKQRRLTAQMDSLAVNLDQGIIKKNFFKR